MYFWNIQALAQELQLNNISEQEKMYYYLAMVLISLFFIHSNTHIPPPIAIASLILTIGVSFWGIKHCFAINAAGDNTLFIERMICLFFPIVVRILIVGTIFCIFLIPALMLLKHYFFITSILEDLETLRFDKPSLFSVRKVLENILTLSTPVLLHLYTYG